MSFDALLLVSFGGPEGPDDVEPFLSNVLRGRQVPPERLRQVASHYLDFGGVSPINQHNRDLISALRAAVDARGLNLPVYWGNRNWHPFLAEAVESMRAGGIKRAAAFVTSAYSTYSGCRQYLENIADARESVGAGAPEIVKIGPYHDRPGFVEPLASGLRSALEEASGGEVAVMMTAHSIPESMAAGSDYERQLRMTGSLVAKAAGWPEADWHMVFQSRSGPPSQPWLGPDIVDAIEALPSGSSELIVVPIGFVSDHMEVVYDLDRVASAAAERRGIRLVRTRTPGTHPAFVGMILDLVADLDAGGHACPRSPGCCSPGTGPARFGSEPPG